MPGVAHACLPHASAARAAREDQTMGDEPERVLVRAAEERDYLLAHVRCVLWRAVVSEEGGRLVWRFSFVNENAAWRYFLLADAGLLPDGTRSFAAALRQSRVPEDREQMRAVAW